MDAIRNLVAGADPIGPDPIVPDAEEALSSMFSRPEVFADRVSPDIPTLAERRQRRGRGAGADDDSGSGRDSRCPGIHKPRTSYGRAGAGGHLHADSNCHVKPRPDANPYAQPSLLQRPLRDGTSLASCNCFALSHPGMEDVPQR